MGDESSLLPGTGIEQGQWAVSLREKPSAVVRHGDRLLSRRQALPSVPPNSAANRVQDGRLSWPSSLR